jgi:4-hydroxyphenylpyruvate dioxygenase
VARAKEAGVPLLEIPLNYYDDLAARFDFDDEFLSELAYYNVLYDRDAQGGELFHVYTEPFEGRFFFEIIQRKNGYAGYGAANVAVRLAAMAKARSGAARNGVASRQARPTGAVHSRLPSWERLPRDEA